MSLFYWALTKEGVDIKRFFTLALGAIAMVAVALISAFITMRLAIHGRESVVPSLTGLTIADAGVTAGKVGLRLDLENRFYSSEPAGRILAQDPAPGSRVRREWPIRITESLGAQRANIPDLTGESERAATINIRRLSLDLGAVAHLSIPGDPDVVLTQTPPVNSAGVDGPRVSLLVSDPEDDSQAPAYVMPSLVGLSLYAANQRVSAAGLRLIASAEILQSATPALTSPTPTAAQVSPPVAPVPASPPASGIVLAQIPQSGRRVVQGDAVHVIVGQPAPRAVLPGGVQ